MIESRSAKCELCGAAFSFSWPEPAATNLKNSFQKADLLVYSLTLAVKMHPDANETTKRKRKGSLIVSRNYKMTTVVERFRDPATNVRKERLACGHVRTDPALHYEGETAFKIKRLAESMSDVPAKARCYRCAKTA